MPLPTTTTIDGELCVCVPTRVLDLLNRHGFCEAVQALTGSVRQEDAYTAVVAELELYGLPVRYSSFDSFKTHFFIWRQQKLGK